MISPNLKKKPAAKPQLTITRVFAAPRSRVFEAWTQKKIMKQWSAPEGFTLPFSKADLRPGGGWSATMRSPRGEDLKLVGRYLEIVPDKKLVFTHAWEVEGKAGHETTISIRLSDLGGKTKMIFRQTSFESAASREGHRDGWLECFAKLKQWLELAAN